MAPSAPMGTYIYCIAHGESLAHDQTRLHAEAVGGPERPLRVLNSGDLAAVVSDVPAGRLRVKRQTLLAHEAVVAEVMTFSDVIPLTFGAVAQNDEAVVEDLLKGAAPALRQQLEAVAGCIELDLKVLWDRERLFEEIVADDPRIRAWRNQLPSAPPYERIALGELISNIIATKTDLEAQSILDQLAPLAVDVKLNRPLTDMMALNAAFLVERSGRDAFDRLVSELAGTAQGRLIVRYSGAVPPYHFIDVSLSQEDAADGLIE